MKYLRVTLPWVAGCFRSLVLVAAATAFYSLSARAAEIDASKPRSRRADHAARAGLRGCPGDGRRRVHDQELVAATQQARSAVAAGHPTAGAMVGNQISLTTLNPINVLDA